MRLREYSSTRSWYTAYDSSVLDVDHSDPLAHQITHFAQVIRGEAEPVCSARDGLKTLMVVDAVALRGPLMNRSTGVGVSLATKLGEAWAWQLSARCRSEDRLTFFHPDGERGLARQQRQQRAKAICAQCPVAAECREHSLIAREGFGVWGGISEEDRGRIIGTRPRHDSGR